MIKNHETLFTISGLRDDIWYHDLSNALRDTQQKITQFARNTNFVSLGEGALMEQFCIHRNLNPMAQSVVITLWYGQSTKHCSDSVQM
jgi:hypothetical protein